MELHWQGERAHLKRGEKAAKRWAAKILNPPTRLENVGIEPGVTVFLEGEFELGFSGEVKSYRVEKVSEADLIFLAAPDQSALLNAPALAKRLGLGPTAALWIVYLKSRTEIREMDVLTAGRTAGLKD